jgi:hypothetical protein
MKEEVLVSFRKSALTYGANFRADVEVIAIFARENSCCPSPSSSSSTKMS